MIKEFVLKALNEDLGRGDLFEQIAPKKPSTAKIIAKSDGVFAGGVYAKALCELLHVEVDLKVCDGDEFKKGDTLMSLKGCALQLLKCERTLLNMTQHASGIATKVAHFVKLLNGLDVKLLDTRKTRPHLRAFEKYAVRCGGGVNHRFGLDDALMLKDTHLAIIEDLSECIKVARAKIPFTCKIEVESESVEQAEQAMSAGADIVMCDNMSMEDMKKVVALRDKNYKRVLIEASGNLDETNIVEVAKTGVDAISSGALIHQAVWVDFSMKMDIS